MKRAHLLAGGIALLIALGVLTKKVVEAREIESRNISALAPRPFGLRGQGTALQAEAFRRPDMLPIFGSSELKVPDPYHANAVFRDYPTGFTPFPIGKAETTSLVILQKVAALGNVMRGKKVAISLSPGWFFLREQALPQPYAGNFSRLHAGALVFDGSLSLDLRRAAAKRMLDYPETLASDTLLRFGIKRLAGERVTDRLLYAAVVPLGRLQNTVLRLQDHFAMAEFIRGRNALSPRKRQRRQIDWDGLQRSAAEVAAAEAAGNPYGFNERLWQVEADAWLKRRGTFNDRAFAHGMERSKEWGDLELLLRALVELGAKPLVLSMPNNGLFFDDLGNSAAMRQSFYRRLQSVTEAHRVKIITFADHDTDAHFLSLPNYHLSSKGWAYYDQALDAFFHSTRE